MALASLQAAYVLHYTPFRDTSFIVDAFTLEHGRVAFVARGARSARSQTRALYQPFRPLLLSWTGRGELHTLTGIEESGPALSLEGHALACAYYFNELLLRLLGKEQPLPELFGHYVVSLAELAELPDTKVGPTMEIILRRFEVQLLELLGLLPDLARADANGAALEPNRQYRLYPGKALVVAMEPAGRVARKPVKGVASADEPVGVQSDGMTPEESVVVHGSTLHAIAHLDFSGAQVREEARQVMRRLLRLHLGGQPLKSRSLFQTLGGSSEPIPDE